MTAELLADQVQSVEAIRQSFPALTRRHAGQPVAYFDGPGGTQVPRPVIDAMADYLAHHNANTHWAFPTSEETDAIIQAARGALADFLNADADEVAFGANMTTLTFHLARALGRRWGAGDEVVVTELDHHANVAPWQAVAKERGVTLKVVPFRPDTGELDWEAMERAIGPKTRLVAIGAASNALGTITDVVRARELARGVGALIFVDAVHFAPHRLVDVRALGCDFLACSTYKFYGPHLGVLYGRRDRIRSLDLPKLEPAPDTVPERLETGTQNHEGIAGAGATVEWLASLAAGGGTRRERLARLYAALHEREDALFGRLWDGLGGISGVTRYGPRPSRPRTGTVSVSIAGVSAHDAAVALAAEGLYASSGDFYATTVVQRLGFARAGLLRIGLSIYSTADEVDRVLAGVERIAAGRRVGG
jgi:cysteine desulfurase family protein (TIGR01976 family)